MLLRQTSRKFMIKSKLRYVVKLIVRLKTS